MSKHSECKDYYRWHIEQDVRGTAQIDPMEVHCGGFEHMRDKMQISILPFEKHCIPVAIATFKPIEQSSFYFFI